MKSFKQFSVLLICLFLFSSPGTGQTFDPSAPTPIEILQTEISALNKDIEVLKRANEPLKKEVEILDKEVSELKSQVLALKASSAAAFIGKTFFNPLPDFIANLGFFSYLFGTLSLLLLLRFKKETIGQLLPFSISLHPSKMTQKKTWTKRKAIIWSVVFLLFILLIALPAVTEEVVDAGGNALEAIEDGSVTADGKEASDGGEPEERAQAAESSPASTDVVAEDKGVSKIKEELEQARHFYMMTELDRLLYVFDHFKEGTIERISIPFAVEQAICQAAKEKNHSPVIVENEEESRGFDEYIRHGSLGYYFLKASLYETAGREGVREILIESGKLLLSDDGAALPKVETIPLLVMMEFFASYDCKDEVRNISKAVSEKITTLQELAALLEILHKVELATEYQNVVESIFGQGQGVNTVSAGYTLTKAHGYNTLAEWIVEEALKGKRYTLEETLELLDLLSEFSTPERMKKELEALDEGSSTQRWFRLAAKAAQWDLKATATAFYIRILEKATDLSHYESLMEAAEETSLLGELLDPLADKLLSNSTAMLNETTLPLPPGFEADHFEFEDYSLGTWTFAQLYVKDPTSAKAKRLIEETVRHQLEAVINSGGALPWIALNDLYGLVYFYSKNAIQGLDVAQDVMVFQQQLRGLFEDNPNLLELRNTLKAEERSNKELTQKRASLKAQKNKAAEELSKISRDILIELAALISKALMLLIALYISLVRAALAIRRNGTYYRFSIFAWTFLETVGFIACCTLVMLPLGCALILLSQDRLKHHGSLALAPVVSPEPPEEKTAAVSE